MELKLLRLLGMVTMVATAWLCSINRKCSPWRTVGWGVALQFFLAIIILKTPPGRQVFELAEVAVHKLIGFANEGSRMVFGPLANTALLKEKWGESNAIIFVITVTATIIVVAALSSLLYHWGILQRVVRGTAWVMQRAMRTSGSESLAAVANYLFGFVQRHLGVATPITLQTILGWVNAPFAWLMGVPGPDCLKIGQVLGERIVLNEFIGYLSLTGLHQKALVSDRSFTLATYALCGFANFG